jgi:hypothetical protein
MGKLMGTDFSCISFLFSTQSEISASQLLCLQTAAHWFLAWLIP